MSTLTLLGIALGLAMDAFAVAIGAGLQLCNVTKRQTFRLAWHFGLFQAFMPILGWLAGLTLVDYIAPVDHWIAFGLLGVHRRQDDLRGAQAPGGGGGPLRPDQGLAARHALRRDEHRRPGRGPLDWRCSA